MEADLDLNVIKEEWIAERSSILEYMAHFSRPAANREAKRLWLKEEERLRKLMKDDKDAM